MFGLPLLLASLATFSAASPLQGIRKGPVKVPLTKRFNFDAKGTSTLPQLDRARAAALRGGVGSSGKRAVVPEDVTNVATVYVATIGIGADATPFTLLIDTGSSNTWVGANQTYDPSSTSTDTGDTVSVSYGSGSFSGEEFIDRVTISDDLVIEKQSIGVSSKATGFNGFDGILGIGPVGLTEGTLSDTTKTIPTVTDNLFAAGAISNNAIGISYAPATEDEEQNGVLSWGGPDSSAFTGDLTFVPITSTSPASAYWGIDQTVTYGESTELLTSSAGIVDTGTTLVLLATDAFDAYQKATGATEDSTTGLLKITSDQYSSLKDLNFNVGGTTFALPPNGQIWPRSLNADLGGDEDAIYLIVADLGSDSGQGLDFINGYSFLERFYSVYDTDNSQVGLATTQHTNATTN